jgi:hypothetical protein
MASCPDCGTPAQTVQGLAQHYQSAVHSVAPGPALKRSQQIFNGSPPTALPGPDVDAFMASAAMLTSAEWSRFGAAVLEGLARSKHLPKAQFERRVDSLLAPFLGDVVSHALGAPASLVVPEFPLKKDDNAQSTNADALFAVTGDSSSWALTEIKTDARSFDVGQLQRYVKAREQGMAVLRKELLQIHAAAGARARVGYWRVKQLLDQAADSVPLTAPVRIVYLVPDDMRPSHLALLQQAEAYVVSFSELERLRAAHQDNVWKVVARLLQL